MNKNQQNRPKKGDVIVVEPIRYPKDIEAIKKMLWEKPRDYLLFVMGINNSLRAGDLLRLKVKDVLNCEAGDTVSITEAKTGKKNVLIINDGIERALNHYIEKENPDLNDYLFKSRKGEGAITINYLNNLVKIWCRSVRLSGNYGAHSLRKTWGYHQRVYHGVDFSFICERLSQGFPARAIRYLQIEKKPANLLLNEV